MDPFSRGIAGEVSEVRRSGRELHLLEWRIPRFLDLPCECLDHYDSPPFGFYDARWRLRVCPIWFSSGGVFLWLIREDDDAGSPTKMSVIFLVGLRGSGGGVERRRKEEEREFGKGEDWPLGVICTRSELREQEERLMPGGTLTVVCVMRVPGTAATGDSFIGRDVPVRRDAPTRQRNAGPVPPRMEPTNILRNLDLAPSSLPSQSVLPQGASSCPDVPVRTDTQTGQPNTCQSLDKQGQQPSDECDICCEAPVDCVLNPCGHMKWCYQCALRFWKVDSPRCPMCRKSIQSIIKTYR